MPEADLSSDISVISQIKELSPEQKAEFRVEQRSSDQTQNTRPPKPSSYKHFPVEDSVSSQDKNTKASRFENEETLRKVEQI